MAVGRAYTVALPILTTSRLMEDLRLDWGGDNDSAHRHGDDAFQQPLSPVPGPDLAFNVATRVLKHFVFLG